MSHIITQESRIVFREELETLGKSPATIKKYNRDINKLSGYLRGKELTQDTLDSYVGWLKEQGYRPSSIQSYLVAAGVFCDTMHWEGIRIPVVKPDKALQKGAEDYLTAEEYRRLVQAAMGKGNLRLAMVIQTISNTDLRISEMGYLTVGALGEGYVEVPRGGNPVRIVLPRAVLEGLKDYMVYCGIWQGPIFLTATGRPVDRTNIWREMKALCRDAGVEERKVSFNSLKKRVYHQYYPVEYT